MLALTARRSHSDFSVHAALSFLVAVLAVVWQCGPAAAAPPGPDAKSRKEDPAADQELDRDARDSARAMAREALALMHEERWGEAHSLLDRAYALVPAPTVAVLDGKALVKLGRLVEAAGRFERAVEAPLSEDSPAAFRKAVEEARSELAELEERIPTLTIVLRGSPADLEAAEVTVDGETMERQEVGKPRSVDPGEHVVAATVDGELVIEDHVLVREGGAKQVVLGVGAVRKEPVEKVEPADSLSPLWGWTALGVGAGGVTMGVAAGSIMLGAKSTLDDECQPTCPPRLKDDLSRFRTSRTVSAVGYVVGAVGVGAGVTLLLVSRSHRSKEQYSLSTDGRSISFQGRF